MTIAMRCFLGVAVVLLALCDPVMADVPAVAAVAAEGDGTDGTLASPKATPAQKKTGNSTPVPPARLAARKGGISDDKLEWKLGAFGHLCERARLAERGFTYSINSTLNAQYNASGGVKTGGAVANRLVVFLNFELGALTRQKRLVDSSIRVSGAWHAGTDINEYTGSVFKPDTNFLDPQVRLFELYWSQYFAHRQISLHAGRVGLGPMEFGMTPLLYDQLSAAFSSNPGAFFANQPVTTFSESVSTWGARLLIEPDCENYSVRVGVYNGWPRDQGRTGAHGLDWSMDLGTSTFLIGEFAYKLNQHPSDTGLPGNYKVGVMHDTGPFDRLDASGAAERGNTGYYGVFDQMLYSERASRVQDKRGSPSWPVGRRWSHPTDEGLYVWGAAVVHPEEAVNLFPYWLTGSLHYKGPIPGRHADRVGIGYRYGFSASDLALKDESSLEAFYACQFNAWLRISANAQYIWNPSGGVNPNAFVVGFQTSVDL